MHEKNGQSTGPKSEEGKAISSKNAQKAGIFTKGYLSWEDVEQKRQWMNALIAQWHAEGDPTKQMLLRAMEQATLGMERAMHADAMRIEGLMQSITIRQEFARQAGFSVVTAENLPAWYFMSGPSEDKKQAIFLGAVEIEALDLQANFSDALLARVSESYPHLFRYVSGNSTAASFVMMLGKTYKQPNPLLGLAALINELNKNFAHHLNWAKDPQRFETIIAGLRGMQMKAGMDCESDIRYNTALLNRIKKSTETLIALDMHSHRIQELDRQNQAYTLTDDGMQVREIRQLESVANASSFSVKVGANMS